MSSSGIPKSNDQWTPLDYPGGLEDGQWERGEWSGLPKLTCTICHWDTLRGLEEARRHARNCPRCQPVEVNKPPSLVLVADKHGKEIKEA